MGWSLGWDRNWQRDIGYGVPAYCDHPKCHAEIDRGRSYVCGADIKGGDKGCGLYFCTQHQVGPHQRCARCVARKPPYKHPKADHPRWVAHKLTDPSWQQWRTENPEAVAELMAICQRHTAASEAPLTVAIEAGALVIRIGVNTLAHAVAFAPWSTPFDEAANDYVRTFAISDPQQFAQDVKHAMLDEREDGSSLLTDLLDKASEAAVDDGSLACEPEQRISSGAFAPLEMWAKL